ncbi:MAG: TonB-dependent receptor domain-containing protein [Croceivirga sp.]
MRAKFRKNISLILGFLAVSLSVTAQNSIISGTVNDKNGEGIIGALIILENSNFGAVADENGNFSIKNIPPGEYRMEITALGFKKILQRISLSINDESNFDLVLEEATEELNEVVVVQKSKAEKIREQGYAVAVINTIEQKNLPTDVNQLLKASPGVNIREAGGLGSGFTLSLNGLSGNQIRYFIDGVPMENFGSSLTLNNFPANLIERIEVYKGVVPVTLGADALGGAVNIITGYRKKSFLDTSFSQGSFSTQRASLNAQYANRQKGFFAKLSSFYNHSDNNYLMRDIRVFDPELGNLLDTIDVKRFHDDFTSAMVTAEVGIFDKKIADELSVGATIALNRKNFQHPDNNILRPFGRFRSEGDTYIGRLRYGKRLKNMNISAYAQLGKIQERVIDTSQLKFNWAGDFVVREEGDPKGELAERRSLFELTDNIFNGQIGLSYDLAKSHKLTISTTLNTVERAGEDSVDELNRAFRTPSTLNKTIVGASYDILAFSERLKTSVFGKGYWFNGEITTQDFQNDDVFTEASFNNFGYGAALSYYITGSFLLKTSYERAYRVPETFEILGNGTFIRPNPNLNPEESDNFNVGARYSKQIDKFLTSIEGGYFLRNAENFIRFVPIGPIGEFENRIDVESTGVEGGFTVNYDDLIRLSTNVTYQNITDQNRFDEGLPNSNFGSRVPNIPYLFGNAQFGLSPSKKGAKNRLQLFWNVRFVEEFFLFFEDLGNPDDKNIIPNQLLQDFQAEYSIDNGRDNVSMAVSNIFDKLAFDNFNIQRPGRAINFKLRYFIN